VPHNSRRHIDFTKWSNPIYRFLW